jgi:maleate isomerase
LIEESEQVNAEHVPPYVRFEHTLDEGIGRRAAIGLIALATEHTVEHEWRTLLARDGVTFFTTRVANSVDINPDSLAAIARGISTSMSVLLPGADLDVVAFGCTSATVVIGEEEIFSLIRDVRPGVACTTPITAAQQALKALKANRIAILTPYVKSVTTAISAYLQARGFDVRALGSFENGNDHEVAHIDEKSLEAAALAIGRAADIDAVFVSCTNIRLAALIPSLESRLGKPVISSNYAMAWHALRLAGIADRVPEAGMLFER